MAAMFKMGKVMRAFYKDTEGEEEVEVARVQDWRKGEIGIGRYPDESFKGWFRFQVVDGGGGGKSFQIRNVHCGQF